MGDFVSHAQNQNVLRRARDFYAVYCASSGGKNYQGLPCPEWDKLTEAVRGHWYVVALRSCQFEATLNQRALEVGDETSREPNTYVLGHLDDKALDVWKSYSGIA